MMTNLKPCPFCGGEAVLTKILNNFWMPQCRNNLCMAGDEPNDYDRKEQAIKAWNTRAPQWISVEDRLVVRLC